MTPALEALFGNRTAAGVLLFIANYGAGHANRIANTYGISVNMVQKQLQRLEAGGVLVSRMVGRSRIFEFNPRNPTASRVRELLIEELDALPVSITNDYFREHQRPRRSGKQL
jgi:predicted ArsR family transcriptional regulator